MNQADIAKTLAGKGVGQQKARVDSEWNFLDTDPWPRPFGGNPTRKALWEQAKKPQDHNTNGPGLSGTEQYLAIPTGTGNRAVILPWEEYDKPMPELLHLTSTSMKLQDLRFSPHNPNIIVGSSSLGNALRVWDLKGEKKDGSTNEFNHVKTFLGHDGTPVQQFAWNPVVPGIIASSGKDIRFYDVELNTKVESLRFANANNVKSFITSLSWSYDGNCVSYVTKADLCLLDLRDSSKTTTVYHSDCYNNKAKMQCAMVGAKGGPINDHLIVTSGMEQERDENNRVLGLNRILKLWDQRAPGKMLDSYQIGESTAAADLYIEPSTGLLMVADKGSHSLQAFDLTASEFKHLGSLRKSGQHKFYTIMDRKYCDPSYGEFLRFVSLDRTECNLVVERIYKETGQNQKKMERGSLNWTPSLFPPCLGRQTPTTAREWEASDYHPQALSFYSMDPSTGDAEASRECLKVNQQKGLTVTTAYWEPSGKLKTEVSPAEVDPIETAKTEGIKNAIHIDQQKHQRDDAEHIVQKMRDELVVSPEYSEQDRHYIDARISEALANLQVSKKTIEEDDKMLKKKMRSLGHGDLAQVMKEMRGMLKDAGVGSSKRAVVPPNQLSPEDLRPFVEGILDEREQERSKREWESVARAGDMSTPTFFNSKTTPRNLDEALIIIARKEEKLTREKEKRLKVKEDGEELKLKIKNLERALSERTHAELKDQKSKHKKESRSPDPQRCLSCERRRLIFPTNDTQFVIENGKVERVTILNSTKNDELTSTACRILQKDEKKDTKKSKKGSH
eukprot:GHVH01005224.1.p1 GENE.GHVH01005224.1~~GHVH01005224.1.p1  ORF type:complete len:790 (-),score=135.47 GHVH01005224.1:1763-4132(-)